jgi:two-component system, NtrC family, response regulator HydG
MPGAPKGLPRVAVVDDDVRLLETWREILSPTFDVTPFHDAGDAMRAFERDQIDVALLDVQLPGANGLDLLAHLRRLQPKAEAIMITGNATVEMAVEALHAGAFDFLCKPIENPEQIIRRVTSAAERARGQEAAVPAPSEKGSTDGRPGIVGVSEAMERVRALIEHFANSASATLITGESGTGKELVARALHSGGARKNRPFIAVNCGAIAEALIDSELFGHERGAFTGAHTRHAGLFDAADGGVLFLDEIGDMPTQTQVRLLRVLQEGEVRPVGATQSHTVDVRVVAATNVDLKRAMREGKFREDLYYRLSPLRIDLPALRDRLEDIPHIARRLLDRHGRRIGRAGVAFSDAAMAALTAYPWPGNVRELANAIEFALTLSKGDLIEAHHLPSYVPSRQESQGPASGTGQAPSRPGAKSGSGVNLEVPYSEARAEVLRDFDRSYLEELMQATAGNLSAAARRSGIDRSNLRRMLRQLGIPHAAGPG